MKKLGVILCLVTFFCTAILVFASDQVQIKVLDYTVIGNLHEGLAKVKIMNSAGNWSTNGFINTKGELALKSTGSSYDFYEGLALDSSSSRSCYINKEGKIAFYVPEGYEPFGVGHLEGSLDFIGGRALISRQGSTYGNVGAIDKTGKIVIPCEYWQISKFLNGYAVAAKNKKMGLIDTNGKIVIPFEYEYGKVLTDGFAFSKSSNFWDIYEKPFWWSYHTVPSYDVYDSDAKLVMTDVVVDDFLTFDMDNGVIIVPKLLGYDSSGLRIYQYKLTDTAGQVLYTAPDGKIVGYLGEDRYVLKESYTTSQLIDSSGNFISDKKYGDITPFSGNYAVVQSESSPDGKYGIIDIKGNEIVPCRYMLEDFGGSPIENNYAIMTDPSTGKSVLITLPGAATTAGAIMAYPTSSAILLDGKKQAFAAYTVYDKNGGASTYVKLRDIAYVLKDTDAKFEVDWENKAITLRPGADYSINGSEMKSFFSGTQRAKAGSSKIFIDGTPVALEGVTLTDSNGGSYNYFKLRDLGNALNFNVTWDGKQIIIESSTDK